MTIIAAIPLHAISYAIAAASHAMLMLYARFRRLPRCRHAFADTTPCRHDAAATPIIYYATIDVVVYAALRLRCHFSPR